MLGQQQHKNINNTKYQKQTPRNQDYGTDTSRPRTAMFGSYGSYSSMGSFTSLTTPMDIAPSTSRDTLAHDRSCAFPSWPRRDSLSVTSEAERPTSYLSDDDLFTADPFEDDARSVSSAGSASSPPLDILALEHMERERRALQREAALQYVLNEKERRRHQAARRAKAMRGPTSSPAGAVAYGHSKKSSLKSKLASMTPIAESGGE